MSCSDYLVGKAIRIRAQKTICLFQTCCIGAIECFVIKEVKILLLLHDITLWYEYGLDWSPDITRGVVKSKVLGLVLPGANGIKPLLKVIVFCVLLVIVILIVVGFPGTPLFHWINPTVVKPVLLKIVEESYKCAKVTDANICGGFATLFNAATQSLQLILFVWGVKTKLVSFPTV